MELLSILESIVSVLSAPFEFAFGSFAVLAKVVGLIPPYVGILLSLAFAFFIIRLLLSFF